MAKTEMETADTFAMLIEALKASRGVDDESLKKMADFQAQATKRAMKPENETHPGRSVYSFPEGDVAHPKDRFKCEMVWVGYPLMHETCTPDEVAYLNEMEPGTYPFKRTDNSPDVLTVTGDRNARGELTRLMFSFPSDSDSKQTAPPMTNLLRDALGKKSIEDELRDKIAKLERQAKAS